MSLNVRIRHDHFDFAHPAEKQVQVHVEVPDVVRVSYMLPSRFWDELRDMEWIDALNTAHDYYEQNVWGDATSEEKKRLRGWLAVDENQDALSVAWFEDRARRDPVSRSLVKERDRLNALIAAMHAASVGCERLPLLGWVEDVSLTRTALLAQQHRAEQLDVVACWVQARVTELETERHTTNEALATAHVRLSELESELAARTFYLADYEGISDGPTLHTTVDAAKAWVEKACADFEDPAGDWYEQDGIWQQWASDPDTDRPTSRGAGSITPLTVQGDGILAEAQRLRQQWLEKSAQVALLAEVRDSGRDEIRRLQTEQGEIMQALGCGRHDEWDDVVHRARQLAGASTAMRTIGSASDQVGSE